jgi:rubrerythrin
MTIRLDEAIKTAIEFEKKVARLYHESEGNAIDPDGRRIFSTLAREEAGHIVYLESRLTEWEKSGRITVEELQTVVPDRARIAEGRRRMAAKPARARTVSSAEVTYLERAVVAERETSAFYRTMVSEVPENDRKLFARFLEIEDGHLALVEAELDMVRGYGFWFGMREFDLEEE